ncbi:hypothetical protein METP3_02848 [Methanosarcinales archaeon]|nr:hypothetical protein METP3_02848 [Methanosarcinales archaeon]
MAEDIITTDIQFQTFMDSMKPPLSECDYELQLSSFKKLKQNKLPYIMNVDHLANLSGASSKQLRLFILNKSIVNHTNFARIKLGNILTINLLVTI